MKCIFASVVVVLLAAGCPAPVDDAGPTDAGPTDAGPTDAGPTDAGPTKDAGIVDAGPGPYGFTYRVPQFHDVPCEGEFGCAEPTLSGRDTDHLCRFDVDGEEVVLYAQSTPTRWVEFDGFHYDTVAWILDADGIRDADASYAFGGNHNNDSLTLAEGTAEYRLYHASFGFGFRACQPPNCVQHFDDQTLVEDGCETDRSLPAVCVVVDEAGHAEELVDNFIRCPGDEE